MEQKTSGADESAFTVGEKVLIRTVTHYQTGEVVYEKGGFLFLIKAAWIADTGRFTDCLRDTTFFEVEPEPNNNIVRVNISAIVDVWVIVGELPREQK